MSNQEKLTEGDIELIKHFLKEGDIKAWVQWEEKKGVIGRDFPELIFAMNTLHNAEKALEGVVDDMVDEAWGITDSKDRIFRG